MVAVLNGGTSVGEAIERGNTGRRRVKAAPNTIQRTNSRCNPRITYYLDALVYPNIPPSLLTGCGIGICVINVSNADGSLVGRSPERNKWTGSTQPNENSRHAADTRSEVERQPSEEG